MDSSNESNNYSATVYVNHYEWFTAEHLKIYNNGQQFKFAYHEEVQQFYEYRPAKNYRKSQPMYSLEEPMYSPEEQTNNISYVEVLSVGSHPSVSSESSASIQTKRSSISGNSGNDSKQLSSKSSNSSKSSSSHPDIDIEINTNQQITNTDQQLTNQRGDFLQAIRDFKFTLNPTPNEPKKPHLFKQNSNPLLTSSYLHQQLDNLREQMQTPSDIDLNDSSSNQWDLE